MGHASQESMVARRVRPDSQWDDCLGDGGALYVYNSQNGVTFFRQLEEWIKEHTPLSESGTDSYT
jgi:hypothetical protein